VNRRAFLGVGALSGYGVWALLAPPPPAGKPSKPPRSTTTTTTTLPPSGGSVFQPVYPAVF
jgi:hypothetical protein